MSVMDIARGNKLRVKQKLEVWEEKSLNIHSITKYSQIAWAIARAVLLIGLGFIVLYPLLTILAKAFRPEIEFTDPSVVWVTKNPTLDHIILAWKSMSYPKAFLKTISISLGSAILQVASCSMIGYGFARFRFKFREVLFALVILTIIIPTQTMFIPLYLQYRFFDFFGISHLLGMVTGQPYTNFTVNFLNNDITFFLPSALGVGLRSGLFIYIFRQFFRGVPKELEEAAKIDGCGPFKTFISIMVPIATAAFITVFLFSMVWHWNESILSSTFYKTGNKPLAVALQTVQESAFGEVSAVKGRAVAGKMAVAYAGILLFITPLILLYLFTQRFFIEGVESTGVKG